MTLFDEIVAMPAEVILAQNPAGRRLALATTSLGIVTDQEKYFLELRPCDDVLESIAEGGVPVLLEHWNNRDGFGCQLENQIGVVREARYAGYRLELLVEFNSNPRGWIWRDLRDGFSFGCSIYAGAAEMQRIEPPSPLPRPYYRAERWRLQEVTILPTTRCRDRSARVTRPANIGELLAEMAAVRAVRQEMTRKALPAYYAAPLRAAVPAIVAAALAAGGDESAVAAGIERQIEKFIADPGDPV